MDTENLIEEIINQVYKRLHQDYDVSLSKDKACHKKKMLLIGELGKEHYKVLEDLYEVIPYRPGLMNFDSILISEMSVEMLGHLGVGCSYNIEEATLLRALLEEKDVYLLESGLAYRRYKKIAYKTLYNLYSAYENKIKQYGIKVINEVSDICLMAPHEALPYEEHEIKEEHTRLKSELTVDLTHKKLLLETDLKQMHIEALTTVEVTKKCIITPLAEDFVRSHKLKIKRL